VFRLAGSLPASVVAEMRFHRENEEKGVSKIANGRERHRLLHESHRKDLDQFEKSLGKNSDGPFWLRKPEVAEIVDEAIRYRDPKEYDLIAHSIMPNHVHLIFEPQARRVDGTSDASVAGRRSTSLVDRKDGSLCRRDSSTYIVTHILENLKWYTALKANRILGRRGAFWHHESYDHVIRDAAELDRTVEYVLMNLSMRASAKIGRNGNGRM
jgi:putative transposase